MQKQANNRVTSSCIEELQPGEIFVFGSNLEGQHGGGAALLAYKKWGAIWGQGVGLQGQTYGIPTMHGGVETIAPYVDEFIRFAQEIYPVCPRTSGVDISGYGNRVWHCWFPAKGDCSFV